jgi:hypothetical protein
MIIPHPIITCIHLNTLPQFVVQNPEKDPINLFFLQSIVHILMIKGAIKETWQQKGLGHGSILG